MMFTEFVDTRFYLKDADEWVSNILSPGRDVDFGKFPICLSLPVVASQPGFWAKQHKTFYRSDRERIDAERHFKQQFFFL
jgi:hypothetical protein